jgi:hypothetical protein
VPDKLIQVNDLLSDAKLQAGDLMIGCFDALLKKALCERSHGGVPPPPVADLENYPRDAAVPFNWANPANNIEEFQRFWPRTAILRFSDRR